jgi:hypothetical protein
MSIKEIKEADRPAPKVKLGAPKTKEKGKKKGFFSKC